MAEDSLLAAEHLHPVHPWWAIVPLFYSALQLMHAKFHEDKLPKEMLDPENHRSRRDEYGVIIKWGSTDVVAQEYRQLATDYKSLFTGSRIARYLGGVSSTATERFWDSYDKIARAVGSRPSSR